MQDEKERGILDRVIEEVTGREELKTDLQQWISFSHDDVYYMLRAYCYNDVWIACYVPADHLIDALRQVYQDEEYQVLLLHGDGEILSGQETANAWRLDEEMLAAGGAWHRWPAGRIQIVKEDSAVLDISIAVVMRGYGGFFGGLFFGAGGVFFFFGVPCGACPFFR